MSNYFAEHGATFPAHVNPAEYVIDVVSGSLSRGHDWSSVWINSPQRLQRMEELEELKKESAAKAPPTQDDYEYASTFSTQVRIVCSRATVQVRDLTCGANVSSGAM
jgi:ATP-binding cassette subfamily G (WHITE) protein 2 (SNQ2)